MNRLIISLAAFMLLTLGSGIGSAAEIYVHPGDSIQTAVDSASSGDVIILKPGTYTENIKIGIDGLEINSESGNPDDTIIKAKNSGDHVITLQADNVKINGLGITGTKDSYTGIYLSGCNNCIIENNKIQDNGYGIYLSNSKGNTISNNKIMNNGEYGILLSTATNNTISENTASDNKGNGIQLGTSDGNTLSDNNISSNEIYGLSVDPESDNNLIYNNYFNNTANADIENGVENTYNTTKAAGENIVGGDYLGGNFWAEPDGEGFSETATDADGDGIADSPYRLSNSIYSDQLPLVSASNPQQPGFPVANFEMDTSSGLAPLSVQFTDLSKDADSWSWDFETDGKNDSVDENPVHVFTKPGNYIVTLNVRNDKGEASKIEGVTVTQSAGNNSNKNTASAITSSPEPADNVEIKETSQTYITGDKESKFNFRNNATCVDNLTFKSKQTMGQTTALIEMLKAKSNLVSEPPSDEVYKYFNIWVGGEGYATSENATSENIENPIVCFKVEKTWMQDKNINNTSITLNTYENGKWKQLPVNLSEEDDKFLYFTAQPPEFSFFAITGKNESQQQASTANSELNSQSENETTDLNGENADGISSSAVEHALENKANSSPGFETVYGVISLIALCLFKRVKPGNK